MMDGDKHRHASFEGRYSSVTDARNIPKPIQQPRVPIMVGGNGPNVTWRLAAKHADELNLDGMDPSEVAAALPTIRARCEEIGRDPATLAISVHMWWDHIKVTGQQRVDRLAGFGELGVSRVMGLVRTMTADDEALGSYIEDDRSPSGSARCPFRRLTPRLRRGMIAP
jgi:alkanesulfonate monooxygenase SsuD/methylene tetrahydromethanopterin reductase-like flavin-dependent oxidoreductase (luciferase family)